MRTIENIAEEFSKKFNYVSDRNAYDSRDAWFIMEEQNGIYYGDCEDYALTLLFLFCNRSYLKFWFYLVTRRAKIQYCVVRSGHAVLVYKGKYIDNIQKKFVTKQDMINGGYQLNTNLYSATTVAIRLAVGKIIGLIFKITS